MFHFVGLFTLRLLRGSFFLDKFVFHKKKTVQKQFELKYLCNTVPVLSLVARLPIILLPTCVPTRLFRWLLNYVLHVFFSFSIV
jgi:hypothetical protein